MAAVRYLWLVLFYCFVSSDDSRNDALFCVCHLAGVALASPGLWDRVSHQPRNSI
jgi:hypothetical protein